MKVILLETVDRLGNRGEIVTVKDGYARNYLFPKNKAKEATPSNMKIVEVFKKKEALEKAKKIEEANALKNRISNLSLTIPAQAGEEEKLFGSITNDMIRDALAAEGIEVDKKDIILEEPIKKLGVYQVEIKVHPEVKATLRVWVVKA